MVTIIGQHSPASTFTIFRGKIIKESAGVPRVYYRNAVYWVHRGSTM